MDLIPNFKGILDQMQKSLECSICLELLSNPVSTKCDHQFCRFCITKFLEVKRSVACPLCKVPITKRGLQERSELTVVIDNVKKLIKAFDIDTETKPDQNEDKQSLLPSSKDVTCDAKIVGKLIHTATGGEPCTTSGSENGRHEQPHQTPASYPLEVPKTRSRTRFKLGSSALNVPPDLNPETILNNIQTPRNRRLRNIGKCNLESGNRSSSEQIVKENITEIAVQPNGHSDASRNGDPNHDKNKKDLLRYLEEGSCGAAFGVNFCNENESTNVVANERTNVVNGDQSYGSSNVSNMMKNVSTRNHSELNKEDHHTVSVGQRAQRRTSTKMSNISTIADKNSSSLKSSKTKLPLSPLKLNYLKATPDKLAKMSSRISLNNDKHSLSKENMADALESERDLLPVFNSSSTVQDLSKEVPSPGSDVSSVSSTQQFMKPKPITARTYSRDMRSFHVGFVKNWADTLPQDQGDTKSELHQPRGLTMKENGESELCQPRGLTMKEKINAKKQGHLKDQQPTKPQAGAITHKDAHFISADASRSKVDFVNLIDKSLTPVPRRRNIFRSRAVNTESRKSAPFGDTVPAELTPEDPYEFKVGHTPVKSERKTADHIDKVIANKSYQNVAKSQRATQVKSRKCTVVDVGNISLVSEHQADKLHELDSVETYSTIKASDSTAGEPMRNGKQETSDISFKDKKMPNLHTQKKAVSFSSDLVKTSDDFIQKTATTNIPVTESIHAMEANDVIVEDNQNVHQPLEGRKDNDVYEPVVQVTAQGSISNREPETAITSVIDIESALAAQESDKIVSVINRSMYTDDNTDCRQTFTSGIDLVCLPESSHKQRNETHPHVKDKIIKPPKPRCSVAITQKRKLARRKKSRCSDSETFSQNPGNELVRLIHKINQAEDHELLFSTQEAHAKLQEETQKEQLEKTAFGFDELESDISPTITLEIMRDSSESINKQAHIPESINILPDSQNINKQAHIPESINISPDSQNINKQAHIPESINISPDSQNINKQAHIPESINISPDHGEINDMHGNLNVSVEEKIKRKCVINNKEKTSEISEKMEILNHVNHSAIIDKDDSNNIKNAKVSTRENVVDHQRDAKTDFSGNKDKSMSHFEPTLLSQTGKPHWETVSKGKIHNFSRPDLSAMIQVSPSSVNILAVSNIVASEDDGLYFKTSLLHDLHKTNNMDEQIFENFVQSISSSDHIPLTTSCELKGDIEHRLSEESSLVVLAASQVAAQESPDSFNESVKPFPIIVPIPSPFENKALIETPLLDPQKSARKTSHVCQLSLKSDISKADIALPQKTSTGLASCTTDQDAILAPDTCVDNVTDGFTNKSNKKVHENDACVVLETLDLDADHGLPMTGECKSYVGTSSYNQLGVNGLEQKTVDIESATMKRISSETIPETPCWSSISTENPSNSPLDPPTAEVIKNTSSTYLKVSCQRSRMACLGTSILTNFDLSQAGMVHLQLSSAVGETSEETGCGSSVCSMSILQPPSMKVLVSDYEKNLAHPGRIVSKCPSHSPPQTPPPRKTKPTDPVVHETPRAQISPQVSSAPSRFNFSDSEDEDHVLIVRRKKRKCFSLSDSPLQPVVFVNRQEDIREQQQLDLCGSKQQLVEGEKALPDKEQNAELIGVTEAMNVIDTWTDEEGQDYTTNVPKNIISGNTQQGHSIKAEAGLDLVYDTADISLVTSFNNTPGPLMEVTPVGKQNYTDSSGKFVIDANNEGTDKSLPSKTKKRLFSPLSSTYLTRSATKGKKKGDSCSHDVLKSSTKLDAVQGEDHTTNRTSIEGLSYVPETSDEVGVDDITGLDNSVVDVIESETNSRKELEKSTYSTDLDISGGLKKVMNTKRGLAKKGYLNLDQSVKHPQGLLSPASKAAITARVKKQAPGPTPYVDSTSTTNTKITDTIAEVSDCCIKGRQDKMKHIESKRDISLPARNDNKDTLHCSPKSDGDFVTAETHRSRKHKQLEKTPTGKAKKMKRDLRDDDEKKQLERELFGVEVKSKKEAMNRAAENTKPCLVNNLGTAVHTSSTAHLNYEDDCDLVFDLGDSTDDEMDHRSCVRGKDSLVNNKETEIDLTEQPDEMFKSSGSLPLTSSPVEVGGNTQQQNIDQSAISAVNETDDEEDNDDSVYMRPKTRIKRLQIISDSDDSDEEVTQAPSQTNCTSSSAFSSQSEMLNTEQQEALEKDVAKLHQQIAEYEAKLDQQNIYIGLTNHMQPYTAISENESTKRRNVAVSNKDSDDVTPVNVDDEDSDDLFVSPLSPSPPPQHTSTWQVPRRPALSKSTRQLDQYIKQFQSPGGTIRTKKSLEFTQSSSLPQSQIKHSTQSKSVTATVSLENSQKMVQDITNKQSSHKISHKLASKDNLSNNGKMLDLTVVVSSTNDIQQDSCLSSPVLLSQKCRMVMSQPGRMDLDGSVTSRSLRSWPEKDVSLVTSGLGSQEIMMVMKLVEKQGLTFLSKFTKAVTHVVIKPASGYDRVCDRTLKFFQGVAHKCWIVAFSWVLDSLQAGCLLPEEDYEILGDTSNGESTLGARHSRLDKDHLFSEFCFACVGDSSEMSKESLQDLLTACGAGVVDDPIGLFSKVAKYKIIVRCADSEVAPTTAEIDMFNGLYKHMGLLTVMREWVLDSLGCYKLQPMADFVLPTGGSIVEWEVKRFGNINTRWGKLLWTFQDGEPILMPSRILNSDWIFPQKHTKL